MGILGGTGVIVPYSFDATCYNRHEGKAPDAVTEAIELARRAWRRIHDPRGQSATRLYETVFKHRPNPSPDGIVAGELLLIPRLLPRRSWLPIYYHVFHSLFFPAIVLFLLLGSPSISHFSDKRQSQPPKAHAAPAPSLFFWLFAPSLYVA